MKELDFEAFRKNLNELIETRGYTKRYVAQHLDITAATLSRYIHGERKPDLIYAARIADFFGVSMEWLFAVPNLDDGHISEETRNVMMLFENASSADRKIIRTILQKYNH